MRSSNGLPWPVGYHIHGRGNAHPLSPMYRYFMHGGGVYKVAEGPRMVAAVPVARGQITGLDAVQPWLDIDWPKLPAKWLWAIYHHAKQAARSEQEQMYHIHHDAENGWRVAVPKQAATRTRIEYQGGDAESVVIDLHSHGELRAFFSETDDADEQGLRIYAVIGRLLHAPEIRIRVGVYGDFMEIDPQQVCAGLGPFRWGGASR